jgi:DNA-binding CsgD family transcriptional regulator
MPGGVTTLSEREKQVLRLLLHGHDAKSVARELGLSVHTVNEHLREARRKTGVSSSREAARRLAQSGDTEFFADEKFGMGETLIRGHRLNWVVGGMLIMSLIIAAAALTLALHASSASPAGAVPKVVATIPQPGATIKPGRFYVSVTYDQPMQPGSMSFAGPRDLAPEVCGTPEQSRDGRTYRLCYLAMPGHHYEIWFNREPYMHFQSTKGVPAQPYRLEFNVSRN